MDGSFIHSFVRSFIRLFMSTGIYGWVHTKPNENCRRHPGDPPPPSHPDSQGQ